MSILVDYFRVGGPSQTAGGRRRKLLTAKITKKNLKTQRARRTAGRTRRKALRREDRYGGAKAAKKILKRRGRGERLGGRGERLFAAKIFRVALRSREKS
jgi:hypothetical protein